MPQKNINPLIPGKIFHIYNRGIAQQNIFFTKENRRYFLELLQKHVSPLAHTLAFCLLSNHFHLLIKIKEESQLEEKYLASNSAMSKPFSNLFNAYTQAINKQNRRTGGLFHRPFKRVLIESERQLFTTLCYIHFNPTKHSLVEQFEEYPYSSFPLLSKGRGNSLVNGTLLFELLGGYEQFIELHKR